MTTNTKTNKLLTKRWFWVYSYAGTQTGTGQILLRRGYFYCAEFLFIRISGIIIANLQVIDFPKQQLNKQSYVKQNLSGLEVQSVGICLAL